MGLVEIKSFSERPVPAGSSQLLKPGLHPAVSASAQLGWTPWSSLPRNQTPPSCIWGWAEQGAPRVELREVGL